MKLLTKEEEDAHARNTLKQGLLGSGLGLISGTAGVIGLSMRYNLVKSLTIPMKVFLVTSVATFGAVVAGERGSHQYEAIRNPAIIYHESTAEALKKAADADKPPMERAFDWLRENRYPIVFGSWLASMGVSFALVHRNPYLSSAQKIVQARVYAQGLTLAVLIASFGLEAFDKTQGTGRWATVKVLDPTDPEHKRLIEKKIKPERYTGEHKWMDMVDAEERRLEEEKAAKAAAQAS